MTTSTRTWNPTDRDRMIYKWVKFDGHQQLWVAQQLNLNQSTVSRIVDRYEKWIAHGGPAQHGALNLGERLRAQLALNYERNEWIISSCLRMASDMEILSDTSKSTTTHYCSQPSREIAVRTESSIRDRSDKACRYLRLAHTVGKNQLELIKQLDLPALEPYNLDPNEYSQAQADARSGLQSSDSPFFEESTYAVPADPRGAGFQPAAETRSLSEEHEAEPTSYSAAYETAAYETADAATLTRRASEKEPLSTPSDSDPASPSSFNIHNSDFPPSPMPATHNHAPPQSPLTPVSTITSAEIAPNKKPSAHAYALPPNPPEPTESLDSILDATTNQPPPPIRILPNLAAQ